MTTKAPMAGEIIGIQKRSTHAERIEPRTNLPTITHTVTDSSTKDDCAFHLRKDKKPFSCPLCGAIVRYQRVHSQGPLVARCSNDSCKWEIGSMKKEDWAERAGMNLEAIEHRKHQNNMKRFIRDHCIY